MLSTVQQLGYMGRILNFCVYFDQVTFYMADTPLLPKKLGWYIQKGGQYYETVQRFTARITETGIACTMRQYRDSLQGSQRQVQPVL